MSWTPPERTAAAGAIHAAAEDDRRTDPQRYSLEPDDVVERALARGVGSTDDFVPGWREGLEQYLGSLAEDADLGALGVRTMTEQAIGKLVAPSKVEARRAARTGGATTDLVPPIVIVGGWRSGTTFLFRLLGTDPRLWAPLPMDLARPWRIAGMAADEREALLARIEQAPELLHVLNPTLREVHPHGARLPEECVLAMGSDLRSWGLSSTARLEGYSRWLAGQDLHRSYAAYRRVLELLDDGDGRRFVLKAPAHTAELRTLVDTFPGAVVVHLHRDVVETIASGASLFAVFRSTYSDAVDPVDVGRFQADQTELWFRRAAAYRSDPHAAGATFVDVAYRDLVADPGAVVTRVLEAAGIDPPADVGAFVDAYRRTTPAHRSGGHRYRPEDFGLDPGEIRERFADVDGCVL